MGKKPDITRTTRRAWLAQAAGLAAGGTAQATQTATQPATSRPAASERIGMGFIGVGGMGQVLLQDFLRNPDVQVVAIADPYDRNRESAIRMAADQGHRPAGHRDFRRLLESPDLQAVVIATPDHWHALTTIHACQAGKDVYVEKPLSHSIAEGRAMVNAARGAARVTQMGIQIHASENFRRVVEIVRSGMLGDISKARIWIASNEAPAGYGSPEDAPSPADVDYDLWLGPAPRRPFNPLRFLFHFRWFWDYAGGSLSDMGCHLLDLVYWSLQLEAPRSVVASGGRYACRDICETPDTLEATWEYPASGERKIPLQLTWSLTTGNGRGIEGRRLGIAFYGTNATLVADYDRYELFAEGERLQGIEKPRPSIPPSPGHRREFLDSIKSRQRCSCDIAYGHQLSIVPLMGNIAYRTGLKLTWDAQKEQFAEAPAANRLLTREYRGPWVLPT